jgi:hypothetical protein
MRTLPLNTRSVWAFLALSPNVLQSGTGSTIRLAGSRGNPQVNVTQPANVGR